MQRNELQRALDKLLTPSLFTDYCPNGLQVEGSPTCGKIATAVSADLATLQKAAMAGVDTLIVHHGLFWQHDPSLIVDVLKRRVELLLKHNISLFAYHLPLDAHLEVGNNWLAAKQMGWSQLELFRDIGVKGELAPMSLDSLTDQLEQFYVNKAVVVPGGPSQIKRVALISGGAYKEIAAAAKEGVDCFISGNFDEPAWSLSKEWGIHYIAMGHTATEKVGVKALCQWIEKNLQKEAFFIDTDNQF